jgi:cell division protein FtsB
MKRKLDIKFLLKIFVILYAFYIIISQQITMQRQKVEISNWQQELQKVKEENLRLQDEVKISKEDKYIQKLAREKLGLIKEGETPIIDSGSNNEKETN